MSTFDRQRIKSMIAPHALLQMYQPSVLAQLANIRAGGFKPSRILVPGDWPEELDGSKWMDLPVFREDALGQPEVTYSTTAESWPWNRARPEATAAGSAVAEVNSEGIWLRRPMPEEWFGELEAMESDERQRAVQSVLSALDRDALCLAADHEGAMAQLEEAKAKIVELEKIVALQAKALERTGGKRLNLPVERPEGMSCVLEMTDDPDDHSSHGHVRV